MKEIKTSLFQIYQCLFKPITFTNYEKSLDKKSKQKLLVRLSLYSYVISILVALTIIFISYYIFIIPFSLTEFLKIAFTIALIVALIIAIGIALDITYSIALGTAFAIAFAIAFGIVLVIILPFILVMAYGIIYGIALGIAFAIAIGIAFAIATGIAGGIDYSIAGVMALDIVLVIALLTAFCTFGGIEGMTGIFVLLIALSIALGIIRGIAYGIAGGINYRIAGGINYRIAGGMALVMTLVTLLIVYGNDTAVGFPLDIDSAIYFAIVFAIGFAIYFAISLVIYLIISLVFVGGIDYGNVVGLALIIALGIVGGIIVSQIFVSLFLVIYLIISVGTSFFVFYSRIFYVLPHLIQYFRAKNSDENSLKLFKKSPIYWDEIIIYPLPFLTHFLLLLTEKNRDEGLSEIEFVSSKRPTQRKAAFNALLEITIKDLSELKSIKEISDASGNLSFLSSFEGFLPKEFSKTLRYIDDLSIDARNYVNASSNYTKLQKLNNVEYDIIELKKSLIAIKGPVGIKFLSLAETWLQIVEEEKKQFSKTNTDNFEEIQNPYIFGNPVKVDDSSRLFVGRTDVVDLIKSNLTSNVSQKPSLFLYGRRRVGKSSVLINLPKLLEKQYISVYIDFQDPRYRESQSSFCYHLSKVICDSLNDRGLSCDYQPLSSFQNNSFTTLGSWLDKAEELLKKENKLVLICFDEYEKIEECILKGFLTTAVLDQLRNIIQHRECFVILISGSNDLRELQLGWSGYFISTKMIKVGYLSKDDARTLITNPIDDFTLNYEGGQYGEAVNQIINLTNCQPYLVQAVCFELVNYLNSQHRKEASIEDVNLAAERVLASANAYFDYIWNIECTNSEREFLHQIIENNCKEGNKKEIDSLLRREVIEKDGNAYKFKVELMKKWIEKNEICN